MENNVIETFIQNGGAKIQSVPDVNIPAIVIGSTQQIESLEHLLDAPLSIKESRKFDDLRGFIEYINHYKTPTTAAFASRERIQVVFDYHGNKEPRWCKHTIEFHYKRSERWKLWEKNNNIWKSQEDFADFLDSGLEEIINPAQSTILDMVKSFRATINAEAESDITASGTSFSYRETIKGSPKKTELEIPEFIAVRVAPFDGLHVLNSLLTDDKKIPVYDFRAKLSWKMKQSSSVSKPDFKVQLLNFDLAVDETLESVRGAIKELTEVPTYIGG